MHELAGLVTILTSRNNGRSLGNYMASDTDSHCITGTSRSNCSCRFKTEDSSKEFSILTTNNK